jgi:hypothetical protein
MYTITTVIDSINGKNNDGGTYESTFPNTETVASYLGFKKFFYESHNPDWEYSATVAEHFVSMELRENFAILIRFPRESISTDRVREIFNIKFQTNWFREEFIR